MDDDDLRDNVLNAIRGRGAFQRFKDIIHRKKIQDDWYSYRNDALKKIAVDFLEIEEIAFMDDGELGGVAGK